ncbi:MAG TPA: UDP-N-acetylglucosamine 2-epimerase (non-hydrolyzing) [Vicinamibacterales bacterium]|nr:UDP-N-acetylglucosamine 2-epimerase (non-hydrolyzing) [Vicinamibacterales bacterium]
MKVLSVVGARPQFIKAAVVSEHLRGAGIEEVLVHTGQHYDVAMSGVFFEQLKLGAPNRNLGIGSGTHADQTGRMLVELERVMQSERPDRVLVYGDTNSTLAGAMAAAKLQLPVDHVEAGLRSFDREMPEELNRVVTDHLADMLLCPTATAVDNLAREGLTEGVLLTGDVMLDLALRVRPAALDVPLPDDIRAGHYFFATVHRASNTDTRDRLSCVMQALDLVASDVDPVILAAHPRLRTRLAEHGIAATRVRLVEPQGYVETQGLILRARGVITDSGGVQKEALFHGVPCLTLRDTTEWIESVAARLNVLVGESLEQLSHHAAACDGRRDVPQSVVQAFGGGRAGACIASAVRAAGANRRRWTNAASLAAKNA